MKKLCWKATWSYSMLVGGFGFKETSQQIAFSTARDGEEHAPAIIGWALGSMLVDVNFYPWGVPER